MMRLESRTVEQRNKGESEVLPGGEDEAQGQLRCLDSRPFVGSWEEAPEFVRDNEYIRKGYRINFSSVKAVVKSLFMLHNETMNVWSHLCGVIIFIVLIIYVTIWITPRFVLPTFQIIKEQVSNYTMGISYSPSLFANQYSSNSSTPEDTIYVWAVHRIAQYANEIAASLKYGFGKPENPRRNVSLESLSTSAREHIFTILNRQSSIYSLDEQGVMIKTISRCTLAGLYPRRAALRPHLRRHPMFAVQRDVPPVLRAQCEGAEASGAAGLRRDLVPHQRQHLLPRHVQLRLQSFPQVALYFRCDHLLSPRLRHDLNPRRRDPRAPTVARSAVHHRRNVCGPPRAARGADKVRFRRHLVATRRSCSICPAGWPARSSTSSARFSTSHEFLSDSPPGGSTSLYVSEIGRCVGTKPYDIPLLRAVCGRHSLPRQS